MTVKRATKEQLEKELAALRERVAELETSLANLKQAEEVSRAGDVLEARVAERTTELREENERLRRELSERSRVEEALHESEERYRNLVELSPDGIAVHREGRIVFANRAAANILGAEDPAQLVGRPVIDIVHPDFRATVRERIRLMREEHAVVPLIEEKFLRLDGSPVDVEVAAMPITYEKQPAILVVTRDVTARKQAEAQRQRLLEEVQDERNRLRLLIDTAPIGIVVHSAPDGEVVLANKAAETIFGQPLAPGIGVAEHPIRYGICLPNGEPFPVEALPISRSLRGETRTGVEMLIRQPSGHLAYLLANSTAVRDASGEITGAIVFFQDISRIREEERLRDEFLSAAAHELRTPVATIKGYVQLVRKWTPERREARFDQIMAILNDQADRIGRRVQEMLEAVRFRQAPPELRQVRFDLGDLAAQVVAQMQSLTQAHHISLQREGPVPVQADRERIEEVLVSLVDNAIKYSPQGGDIEVRVWAQQEEAFVAVKDHGVGIPKERQPHIFVPFYEAVPSGTPGYHGIVALSLYLSKLAMERHKGRIWFESEEGKGSTFYISLPRHLEGEA